jgi:hypothetical protein
MLSIDALAGNDMTKWNQVLTMSYDRVLFKLLMNAERQDYMDRYREVINAQK